MEVHMKKITVVKPFSYYLNGYERRDFTIGVHDVPYDCAAYAVQGGYANLETAAASKESGGENVGTTQPGRSKKTPAR